MKQIVLKSQHYMNCALYTNPRIFGPDHGFGKEACIRRI